MGKKDEIDFQKIPYCCDELDRAIKKKAVLIDELGFFYIELMNVIFYYCPWCGMPTFDDSGDGD
jgi:hypothetical protein